MPPREEILQRLSKHFDPRAKDALNKAILDTLQEVEPCNMTDLRNEIDEKYECTEEIFTYKQVRDRLLVLHSEGIVKRNALTGQFIVAPEYKTSEVAYLPVSNYCIGIFVLSAMALAGAVYYGAYILHAVLLVTAGSMYLIGQYLGAEFDFNGTYEKIKVFIHIR